MTNRAREQAVDAVVSVLEHERAGPSLDSYFSEGNRRTYTGRRFETFATDEGDTTNVVTRADLLALALLSIDLRGEWLLAADEARGRWSAMLREVPCSLHLRDASDDLLSDDSPLSALWQDMAAVGGGRRWVTASKLLARKRPRLVPVFDRVVRDLVTPPEGEWWVTMRAVLRDPRTEGAAARLRALGAVRDHVSDLRLIDVVLWMAGTDARRGDAWS